MPRGLLDFGKYLLGHTDQEDFLRCDNGSFDRNPCARMAAYIAQDGKCYVTGLPLEHGCRELHHRRPRSGGGNDTPENLVMVNKKVHRLIHSHDSAEITQLSRIYIRTGGQRRLLNQLRYETGEKMLIKATPWEMTPKRTS